jgi:hypothetical protein
MVNELLRITKIASTTRLSDRYLTVQIKDAPDPEQTNTYGKLCALVEIEGSWQSNAQVGQTIINTLSRQYFRGTSQDPLTNFEEALKRVNETLTQASHTGSTDWIGHLHAAIVVVVRNEIHIATTGQVYAVLFRENNVTPMLDEKRDTAIVPGKVFGTLLSGTIEDSDQLLIASSGLAKIASQQEIQHCFSEAKNANDSIHQLGELLRAKRGRWVNALCIDAAGNSTEQEAQTVVLAESTGLQLSWRIARLRSTTQRLLIPISGWLQRTKTSSGSWSSKQLKQLRQDTIPQLQKQSTSITTKLKAWLSSRSAKKNKSNSNIQNTDMAATSNVVSEPLTENLIGKSVYAIRDYNELTQPAPASKPLPAITDYTETKSPKRSISLPNISLKLVRDLLKKIEWRPIFFGLIALILLTILLSNIHVLTTQKQNEQSKQTLLIQLDQLKDSLEKARLARSLNQPEKAAAAIGEVQIGLPPLLASSITDIAKGAKELQEKTQVELDTLTQTNRLNDLKKITHVDSASRLARSQDTLALVDSSGAALTSLHITDAIAKNIPLPSGLHITAMTAYDGKAGIVTLTDQGAFQIDDTGQQLTALTTSKDTWKSGNALTTFFNNLYALDVSGNQIWKYSSTQNGFGKAEGYINDGSKLDGAIDVAVDGQLFVLKKDGGVLKFNKGKNESFTLTAPPMPTNVISDAKQLLTTKDSSYLYLLDGGRILKFDKTGHFQTQYAFNNISSIDSFSIDEPNKTIFIISDGTVYSTSY